MQCTARNDCNTNVSSPFLEGEHAMPFRPAAADASKLYVGQLTAIRGIACLVVLIGHVVQIIHYGPVGGGLIGRDIDALILNALNAEGAVLLFFVLSGCVLAVSLRHVEHLEWRVVCGFYVKRIFRLYPLLWLATCIAMISVLVARPLAATGVFVGWLTLNLQAPLTPIHTLLSLAGVWTKYDGPMWSLRVELIYSALFPVIYLLVRRPRLRFWCITALLGLALLPVAHSQIGTAFGLSFALGALIPMMPRHAGQASGWVVLAALALLCYDRGLLAAAHPPEKIYDILESFCAFIIVRDIYVSGTRYRLLSARPLAWIGDLSFSIYLLHLPVLLIIFTALQYLVGLSPLLSHPSLTQLGLCAATAGITILLSVFTYRSVELPLHDVGRRLAARIAVGPGARATLSEGVAAGATPLA
jgi:peptidoglycan/LPS O-acetylase OafA/YrhL